MPPGAGAWQGSDPPTGAPAGPSELVGTAPLCKATVECAGSSPHYCRVEGLPNVHPALHPREEVGREWITPAYTPGAGEQDGGTTVHPTILCPGPCGRG